MEIVFFLDTTYRDNSYNYTLPNFSNMFQRRFSYCLVTPGNATLEGHFLADAAAAGRAARVVLPDTPGEWDKLPDPVPLPSPTPEESKALYTAIISNDHDYFIKRLRGFKKAIATNTNANNTFLIALHGAWLLPHPKLSHSLLMNYFYPMRDKILVLVDSVYRSAQGLLMNNSKADWFFDAMIARQQITQAAHLEAIQGGLSNAFVVNGQLPATGGPAVQRVAESNPKDVVILPVKVSSLETPSAVLERFVESLTQNKEMGVEEAVSSGSAMPYIFIGLLALCVVIGVIVAWQYKSTTNQFVKIYV